MSTPPPASSSYSPSHPAPLSGGPVMMRVLCLHGADHSGLAFRSQLSMLEERLYTRHGIELVYVDSPLCGREDAHDGGVGVGVAGVEGGDGREGPSDAAGEVGEAEVDDPRGDEGGDGREGRETTDGGGPDSTASMSASPPKEEDAGTTTTTDGAVSDDALVPRDPSRSSVGAEEEAGALRRRPPPFLVRRWFNRRPTPVVSAANNGGRRRHSKTRSGGSDDGGGHETGVGERERRRSPVNPGDGGVVEEDLCSGEGEGDADASRGEGDVGDDDDRQSASSISTGDDVPPPGESGEDGGAQSPPPPPPPNLEYVGLDASLLHVSQVWNRERRYRPFRGIMAFDQGAALAGVLPLIEAARKRGHRGGGRSGVGLDDDGDEDDDDDEGCGGGPFLEGLDFLVLSSGYVLDPPPTSVGVGAGAGKGDGGDPRGDGEERESSSSSSSSSSLPAEFHLREDGVVDFVSTLHLIGTKDEVVGAEESRRLARRFANAEVYEHPGGHTFPTRPRDLNVIGKFLVERKKDLLFELGGDAQLIFETQRQLRLLEETATSLVTSTVGMDPPRALMAVIAPNAVGGWTGPKLRDPTDGGGAPCPPEFVMRRDERPRDAARGAKKFTGGGGGDDEGEDEGEGEGEGHGDGPTDESENYRDASREHPSASAAATRP